MYCFLYYLTMTHDTHSTFFYTSNTLAQTLWLLCAGFSTVAGMLLIAKLKPGLPVRILAVAVPVACGVAYIWRLLYGMKQLDELQLRIHLEAAATACVGVFVAAIIYPVFQIAGFIGRLEPYYVVFLIAGLLGMGYFNAVGRYR
jgi:hypothetical protein